MDRVFSSLTDNVAECVAMISVLVRSPAYKQFVYPFV